MRKLLWFTVGFTAACAVGIYLLSGMWFLMLGLFCLIAGVALLAFRTKPARITAVIMLGCVIGFVLIWILDTHYLSNARASDGETLNMSFTAADFSYDTGYGCAFDATTELEGKTYQARVYLNEEMELRPGDTVYGEFRLRYTASGGAQDPTYHQGKRIFLLAYQEDAVTRETADGLRLRDYPALWRKRLTDLIGAVFSGDTAPFAKALLLGDSRDLTYAQQRDFQLSGIRHIIAVSGLHVSILFSLIYMAFGRQRVLNALFGLPLLLVFAALSGFTPSIVRACLMQALMLLAMLADKEYDPPTSLAFAVLVILAVNPNAITSVSFQLSVGCMVGIFAFHQPLHNYFLSFGKLKKKVKGKSKRAKLLRWLINSVSVTLSAMVTTTPLCAVYFGTVSLVGVLANLLTLWVVSFIFYGILLACLGGVVWLPAGRLIGWITGWPIRYVLWISGLLADFPLAAVYTESPYIVSWIVMAYVLLGVFLLLKKRHPGLTAATVGIGLCLCIALSWLEPRLDDTRVSVINVGQGQSILLQQGNERYLVDCGSENTDVAADTAANFLAGQGIFHLDGVILTHYDTDHAGSLVNLLYSVDTDKIYMPDIYDSNGIRESIEAVFGDTTELVNETMVIPIEDGKITLYPGENTASDNESSVCVLFQAENCDILITGDRSSAGERALLAQTQLPQLELLVAGHHGSHHATSFDLLLATRPKAVAISVGADNPYGHPRQEVLERLERFGCRVYRTDLQGTIIFRR